MIAIGLFLLFAHLTSGVFLPGHHHTERFIRYYTSTAMMNDCYGAKTIRNWSDYAEKIFTDCYKSYKESQKSATHGSENDAAMNETADSEDDRIFYTAAKVNWIRRHYDKTRRIVQCSFDKFNLTVGEDGLVDVTQMKNKLSKTIENQKLKTYVSEGIDDCRMESACGQFNDLGSKSEFVNFFKLVKFYRCVSESHLTACIKHDMDKRSYLYDVNPLKDIIDGFDDSDRRMLITASYANSDKTGLFSDH